MNSLSANEHSVQCAIADLLRLSARKDVIWYAVPNGGLRSRRTAGRLQAEGVQPGVADMAFILPSGRAGFVEVKTAKGRQSDAQKAFEARCQSMSVPYAIVRSVTEAERLFKSWGILRQHTTATAKAVDAVAMAARGRG